ncbi:MAG: hypothetical protein KDJ37_13200 [Hyphomicrobiaceae bacterium]|nr:hypothetical protein [Hyphomicrobiaceae bacterium]
MSLGRPDEFVHDACTASGGDRSGTHNVGVNGLGLYWRLSDPAQGAGQRSEAGSEEIDRRQLTVSLLACPELPAGTSYLLVRREADGSRQHRHAGVLRFAAPSLNLARIRHRGACLGANEVVLILPQGAAIPKPVDL